MILKIFLSKNLFVSYLEFLDDFEGDFTQLKPVGENLDGISHQSI